MVRELIKLLNPEERKITLSLLGYPENSIGRLMTPDYVYIYPYNTVAEVFDTIRKYGKDSETINVLYIINEKGELIDDIRIRDIILAAPDKRVEELIDGRFIALNVFDDQETANEAFKMNNRDALPVVSNTNKLLGIVTIDDVLWVSAHAGPNIYAMPQIHTKSGALSRQWAVLAARALEMKMPLRLAALTVQTAACTQVRGGCPTTGISAWDAWAQLRRALDAIPATAGMPLGAPMDIRWGWANGFVIPPPTTTSTTTTVTLSGAPNSSASPTSRSVASSAGIFESRMPFMMSSGTTPERPSEHNSQRSPGLVSKISESISGYCSTSPSTRISTLRRG